MAQIPKKKTTGSVPAKDQTTGKRQATPGTVQVMRPSTGAGVLNTDSKALEVVNAGAAASSVRTRPGMAGATGRQTPTSTRSLPKRGISGRTAPADPNQLRGLPLALKFSIPISLLVIVAMSIFGYLATQTTESQLNDEIVNSGYGQLQALQRFGQDVILDFRNTKEKKEEYDKKFAAHRAYVQRILDRNPRIYDIVIYASTQNVAVEVPDGVVLQGREGMKISKPPKERIKIKLPNADQDVLVYNGTYVVKGADGEHAEPSLYFRIPIREGPEDKDPVRMFSSLNVILSAKEIREEVGKMKRAMLLLGLILTGISVGVALLLARYTVRPIKELVKDMNAVAAGELEHQSPVAETSTDEVGLLATAFNQMTSSLRSGRDSERENQRISGELNTAKSIHIKLMPEKLPQLPGIDIFTAYQSAKEVGGDYYDFIPVGDAEHLAMCVADVSGKGIPGSMVMGTTRTILRMMAVGNQSPAEVLAKTNYHVARDIKRGMFVTCVYCILNVRTRELVVASAGHNPMLIFRAATGTIEKVRPNGIALGFDKGPIFNKTIREERLQLEVGDRVVLYTDGVVEAMNAEREEWSDEALDAFTLQNAELPSKDFVRLLINALDDHKGEAEQHDDITVTTFRVIA
ncbi:MAG: SpoIIE family protein phosphatase [Planctomycetota bacterium]